ncbi:MAG: TonB-dependent receptor plug domain-containing protein [Acidobacteriota bacterium]
MKWTLALTLGVALGSGVLALAVETNPHDPETQAETTHPSHEVVVVGTPVIEGNKVDSLGSQVTVIARDQIEGLNAQDLLAALRKTPGVLVSRHNPVGSFGGGEGGAVFIRGQGSSRPGAETQIATDGIARFVSVWTHPLMDVLSIDLADSVEVYKGTQPVLFGNMASAVVNVVPKRMEDEGFSTRLEGALGSYDTRVEVAEHGGKKGPLDYYLVQSYRASEGHRDHASGEVQSYFGRIGYALNGHWEADLTFNRVASWADDPGPSQSLVPPDQVYRDGRFSVDDYFTVASLYHKQGRVQGYVKGYWERGSIDWTGQHDELSGLNDENTFTNFDNYGLRVRETLQPWDGGEIIAGLDVDNISGKVRFVDPPMPEVDFDRETYRIIGPHLALSQRFQTGSGVWVRPSAGVRFLSHDRFGDELAPQVGVAVGVNSTELHAAYARGVNFPGVYVDTLSRVFIPGQNRQELLSAERADHFELGVGQGLGDMAKIDITLFSDDASGRIVLAPPPPFPPVWTNVGNTHTKGVETVVTLKPQARTSAFGGLTYLDASPADLPYAPKWTGSFGLAHRFLQRLQCNLDGVYVGKHWVASRARQRGALNTLQVNSYFLLNAKLTYDIQAADKLRAQLFAAGENLTDTSHQQKFGYPMPGANVMFGLTLHL